MDGGSLSALAKLVLEGNPAGPGSPEPESQTAGSKLRQRKKYDGLVLRQDRQ
jgi:hypothetical protein